MITWPGRIIQSHTSSLVVCHGIAVRIYFGMLWKSCRPEYDINCGWARFRHDDVIKWKQFPRQWPLVRGIHRWPVNFPRNGQWRGALMFSLICAWINGWVNNREAGDLRPHSAHHYVNLMIAAIYYVRTPVMSRNFLTNLSISMSWLHHVLRWQLFFNNFTILCDNSTICHIYQIEFTGQFG